MCNPSPAPHRGLQEWNPVRLPVRFRPAVTRGGAFFVGGERGGGIVNHRYLVRNKRTCDSITLETAADVAGVLWGKRASEWDVWRRCELTSREVKEIRAELERGERAGVSDE